MSKTQELTSERLREALEYEPESGVFTWRHRMDAKPQWNARHAGRRAGSIGSDGYRRITIDDVKHKASRLAFLYMKGAHPPDEVDHTDGQRDDDRWANLNSATHRQNMANRQVHRSNKLGIKGVCWYRLTGKYEAKISAEGKIGTSDTSPILPTPSPPGTEPQPSFMANSRGHRSILTIRPFRFG